MENTFQTTAANVVIRCSACGGLCRVEPRHLGQNVRCPRCDCVFSARNELSSDFSPIVAETNVVRVFSSWIITYRVRCGTWSFTLQLLLLAWTAFVITAWAGVLVQVVSHPDAPNLGDGNWFSRVVCFPLGIHFLVALPLAIGALATLENRGEFAAWIRSRNR